MNDKTWLGIGNQIGNEQWKKLDRLEKDKLRILRDQEIITTPIINNFLFERFEPNSIDGEVTNKGETLPVRLYSFNNLAPDPDLETWVIIHGFNSNPTANNISRLTNAVASENGGNKSQVILLDWSAPADQMLPELAAEWIHDVAEFAVNSLQNIWGIEGSNINLIGHSLGSYVASEIGSLYDNNINNLIALDPALNGVVLDDISRLTPDLNDILTENKDDILNLLIQVARILSDQDTYDTNGDLEGIQAPVEFNPVSNFSRAFWGDILKGNGLGSARYAHSADESFELVFEQRDNVAHHGDIVINYANILLEMGLGEIAQRTDLEAPSNSDEWQILPEDEGIMAIRSSGTVDEFGNDPDAIPSLLVVNNANSNNDNDQIIYGSLEDDFIISRDLNFQKGSSLFNSRGNDTFYGDGGQDKIIDDEGNDFLIGGNDSDYLSSGSGNDILVGVESTVSNPGLGERDILAGGTEQDLFILGDETQVYYNSNLNFNSGLNDYALMTDFSVTDDRIQLFGNREQYELGNSPEILPEGTAIFYQNSEINELIGLVQNVFDLSLEEDYFVFV